MLDQLKEVRELQEQAKTYRKKGDTLRRVGREDAALEAYRGGLAALTGALEILGPPKKQIAATSAPLPSELETFLHELVETFGARAGMLLRLKRLEEASESYSEGAALELRFDLPSTYNRLNAAKYLLLAGKKRLRELEPQLRELAAHIETSLIADKSLSDSGWAWADLGDCMALLGKPEDARKAYLSFISKAEIRSPERTLDVLKEIASRLNESADPDAPRLQAAIDILQSGLAA
jgi:predicted RNA polymerase sigma factor